jgi:ABC-type nitrate/sulfonate/bicarbonate transport system permease component
MTATYSPAAQTRPSTAKVERQRLSWTRRMSWLWSVGGVVGFLVIWQVLSKSGIIPQRFFSSPSGWGRALYDLAAGEELWTNLYATMRVLVIGLAASLAVAIPSGLVIGCFRPLELITRPLIAAFQSVPYVAVLPLIIIIFGINDEAKIIIVMFATVFPLMFNTIDGVLNISETLLRVPRAFCISRVRTIVTVVVPASLPYILSGVRISVGRALVAAIVAEFFMSTKGIGYYVSEQANAFNTDNVFAGLIVMAFLGIILVKGVGMIEDRFARWKS